MFFPGQRRQLAGPVRKEDAQDQKNHCCVSRNVQPKKHQIFRDQVVSQSPGNPTQHAVHEGLHQVDARIGQVRKWLVKPQSPQDDGQERDENAPKNGNPDELSAHAPPRLQELKAYKDSRRTGKETARRKPGIPKLKTEDL
jgi:hypothetical protein